MAKKPTKKGPGRPTKHTPKLAATICGRIADGEPLRSVCRDTAMPDKSTVLRWLGDEENLEFRDQYARAREIQADVLFDEVLEIADDTSGDWSEDDDGRRIFDHEHVQRSRLRVDARKWAAGKLAPKRYDTKDRPITFDLPDIESSDDLVKAMAAVLVAVSVGNITLAEGQAFAGLIDVHRRAIEAVDLDRRVNALEERLGNPK